MEEFSSNYEIVSIVRERQYRKFAIVRNRTTQKTFYAHLIEISHDQSCKNSEVSFRQEIEIVSSLDHPNIARLKTFFIEPPLVIAIYDCTGTAFLSDYLKQRKILSVENGLMIIRDLLDALDHVHSKSAVFCGIDPERIVMSANGVPFFVDFTYASQMHFKKAIDYGINGFYPFISPEQTGFTGFIPDNRSDTYCAGLLLYTLLSGQPPFLTSGDDLQLFIDNMIKKPVCAIENIPAPVNAILLKALRPSPDERYQTAKGMKHDILEAISQIDNPHFNSIITGQQDVIYSVINSNRFVGRIKELDTLRPMVEKMKSGDHISAMIRGDAGIGKSELIHEIHKFFDLLNISFVNIRCEQFSSTRPYYIIRHLITSLLYYRMKKDDRECQENLKLKLNLVLGSDSGTICRLIPEITPLFYNATNSISIEKEKENNRTIYILSLLFQVLCEQYRISLSIDDIQWIDQSSFRVLKRILENRVPCFLLLAMRSMSQNANDNNVEWMQSSELSIDTSIELHPFTQYEIECYVRDRFSCFSQFKVLTDVLYEKTDGSPAIIKESIEYMLETKIGQFTSGYWRFDFDRLSNLPKQLDFNSMIVERKNRLDFKTQLVLDIIAICGVVPEPAIVAKICEHQFVTIILLFRGLEKAGFLKHLKDQQFLIVNKKTFEVISNELSADKKRFLQLKLAEAYEQLAITNHEYMANAAELYLMTDNCLKSIECCYAAAMFACDINAFDIAIHYLEKVIGLFVNGTKSNTVPNGMLLRKKQGEILMLLGENKKALAIITSLLDDPGLDSKEAIEIKYLIGTIHHNMGNFELCLSNYTDVLAELGVKISTNRINVGFSICWELLTLAFRYAGINFRPKKQSEIQMQIVLTILNKMSYLFFLKNILLTFRIHVKALNLAERSIENYSSALIYADHIMVAHQLGLRHRAYKVLSRFEQISTTTARDEMLAHIYTVAGVIKYFDAEWDQAKTYLNKAIEKRRSMGDLWGQLASLKHLGFMEYHKGNLSTALEIVTSEWNLSEKCGDRRGSIRFIVLLKFLLGIDNDQDWNQLYQRLKVYEDPLVQVVGYISVAIVSLIKNNIADAYATVLSAFDIINKNYLYHEYVAPAFSVCCSILTMERLGRTKGIKSIPLTDLEIRSLHIKVFKKFKLFSVKYPAHKGVQLRCKAWLKAFNGQKKIACRLFKDACRIHHTMGMRYEEGKSFKELALFYEKFGFSKEASDARIQANTLFRQCGAIRELSVEPDETSGSMPSVAVGHVFGNYSNIPAGLRLDILHKFTASIHKTDDLQILQKQILQVLLQITGAREGSMYLESKFGSAQPAVGMNFDGTNATTFQGACPGSLYSKAKEHTSIFTGNISMLYEAEICTTDHLQSSLMIVPLHGRKSFFGCACLVNDMVAGLFSQESIKIAEVIASQASILIENAVLLEQYRLLNDQLKSQVKQQTIDISNKKDIIEQFYLKAIDSQRVKDLLFGAIVHDVKNVIFSIAAEAKNLIRHSDKNKQTIHKLNNITQNCTTIFDMSINLLDITRMEEGKIVVQKRRISSKELYGLFNKYVNTTMFEAKNIKATFIEPAVDSVKIYADPYLLDRLFQNLLNNAAEYVPNDGLTTVSFSVNANETIISFFSSGAPIPESVQNVIFEKFSGAGVIRSTYSKGFGLFFCKLVMKAHEGRIWVECSDRGNCFKLAFTNEIISSNDNCHNKNSIMSA